jgi:hypothetical protein
MKLTENLTFLDKTQSIGQEIMRGLRAKEEEGFGSSCNCSLLQKGNESIFSGIIGMLLFLLELSQRGGDNNCLVFAQEKMERIADRAKKDRTLNFSLYNGKMGIVHALTRFYQATGNDRYLDRAMGLARECPKNYLHYCYASDTLFDGRAGTLLTLLRLHSLTGENWLLEAINGFIGKIIKNAITDPKGLYWSATNRNARGESGFGYGVAGIGYVFLELGHYFGTETFYSLAESVFRYEDGCWDSRLGNWAACHREISNSAEFHLHYDKLKNNEYNFFNQQEDDTSWSNGTIGIGLTRLRAWQLTAKTGFRQDVTKACDKLTLTYDRKYTLLTVSEKINYGLFFLEVSRVTDSEEYFQRAALIANELDQGKKPVLPEELAGMAHLFMQLESPVSSVFLLDILPANKPGREIGFYPYITLEKEGLEKMVLRKDFYRTMHLLEYIDIRTLNDHLRGGLAAATGRYGFIDFVKRVIPGIDKKYRNVLWDLFYLEKTKLEIAENFSNGALLHIRETVQLQTAARLLLLDKEHFLETTISLCEDITLVRTIIHPNINTDDEPAEDLFYNKRSTTTLLKPTAYKLGWKEIRKSYDYIDAKFYCDRVSEVHLTPTQEKLIAGLTRPRKIGDILERTIREEGADPILLRDSMMETIRNFLASGILKPCA